LRTSETSKIRKTTQLGNESDIAGANRRHSTQEENKVGKGGDGGPDGKGIVFKAI
jgi:hypothetical protein